MSSLFNALRAHTVAPVAQGAAASLDLRPEEIRELQDLTCYEPKEIQKLFKRFRRLDRGFRGTISAEDLIMVPELAMNPLAPRLVALFPRDAEDRINFTSFVTGLAVFSENCPAQRRIRGASYVCPCRVCLRCSQCFPNPLLSGVCYI